MSKIRVIFIRHGERRKDAKDHWAELTNDGAQNVHKLAVLFNELGIKPNVYLTSAYEHAKQTTNILADGIANSNEAKPAIIEAEALTPMPPEVFFTVDNLFAKVTDESASTLALVGHEPRLSQLITLMTGTRLRPLERLDVVCVEAKDFQDLRLGCGEIAWRIPVKAYQESELRSKVTAKMTVATFLAGFTFTALLEVLMNIKMPTLQDLTKTQSPMELINLALPLIATICLTASIALFIAAVYIYDLLSMPEGFWATSRAAKWQQLPRMVQNNKNQHGLIYGHMLHAWIWIFTPGVILATIGFLLIIAHQTSIQLSFFCLGIILAVVVYYRKVRPMFGVD